MAELLNPNMPPQGVDELVSGPHLAADPNGPPPGLDEFIAPEMKAEKYGTLGQQAITGLEGVAKGIAGPLAPLAETKVLGVKPEDIRAREEENPTTAIASEVAGFVGPAIASGGASALGKLGVKGAAELAPKLAKAAQYTQAGLITRAGEAATAGMVANTIAKDAAKGAFEAALFQGGEELSRAVKEDPQFGAESAIADLGLAAVGGGVFGGALGAAMRKISPEIAAAQDAAVEPVQFISQMEKPAFEAGDFTAGIKHLPGMNSEKKAGILAGLGKLKKDAPEIRAAAERLGAPVMEGMIAGHPMVQVGEDALLHSPTVPGLARQKLYQEGYNKAAVAVDEALGETSPFTKAELGNKMKDALTGRISEQNEPIAAMYKAIKEKHDIIPVNGSTMESVAAELASMPELRHSPSAPSTKLANDVIEEIKNLQTVDDIKMYKSGLRDRLGPTAPPAEKRMVSIISDKLTDLEENSIEHFAKHMSGSAENKIQVRSLIEARKEANKQYKTFITKVKTLAEQLGKGRVHGAQDAIHFIQEHLTPEEVTQRLFSKKDSEFLKFFAKEFPAEAQLMRDYQKKVLLEGASKTGELSHKTLFNNINKLEPEIRASIFNKDELRKIVDAETYIRSFPINFNPSGTSHMESYRKAFEKGPLGMANAHVRDYAIRGFMKAVAMSPDIKNATTLGKATVSGDKKASKAIKDLFDTAKHNLPNAVVPISAHRNKLMKLVDNYQVNPEEMLKLGDNNPVSEYSTGFSQSTAAAMTYLASVKPNTDPKMPLDSTLPPPPEKVAAYNNALDIAQSPLTVLNKMQKGTLTPKDVHSMQAMYPSLYKSLSGKLVNEMMTRKGKGQPMPYKARAQASMFIGQPLDSTLTPDAISSIQTSFSEKKQQNQAPMQGPKRSTSGLDKIGQMSATPSQNRAADKAKH